jgi:hypothetical protein
MTLTEQLLLLEKKLPKWILEGKEPTQQQIGMLTNEQIANIQEWLEKIEHWKDPNQRDAMNVAAVGMQAQGKSFTMSLEVKKIYQQCQENGIKRRILIYLPNVDRNYQGYTEIDAKGLIANSMMRDSDPRKWKDGIRIFYGKNHKLNVETITTYFTNGTVVFEEANEWFNKQGSAPKWQLIPFSQNRHRGVDNIICLHKLMDIPATIREYFSGFYIFKTGDYPTSRQWFIDNGFKGDPQTFFDTWHRVYNHPIKSDQKDQYCEYFDARVLGKAA